MNPTDLTDALQLPATQSEQHSVPEPSTTPLDEPEPLALSRQEAEGAITETVLQIEPNNQASDNSTGQDTSPQSRQGESKSLPKEKVVVCVVTGVLSMFTMAMADIALLSGYGIVPPVALLAVNVILFVFDIIAFPCICRKKYQMTTKGAFVPIFFSLIGGAMIVLIFSIAEVRNHGIYIAVDWEAVHMSAGGFGGTVPGLVRP